MICHKFSHNFHLDKNAWWQLRHLTRSSKSWMWEKHNLFPENIIKNSLLMYTINTFLMETLVKSIKATGEMCKTWTFNIFTISKIIKIISHIAFEIWIESFFVAFCCSFMENTALWLLINSICSFLLHIFCWLFIEEQQMHWHLLIGILIKTDYFSSNAINWIKIELMLFRNATFNIFAYSANFHKVQ